MGTSVVAVSKQSQVSNPNRKSKSYAMSRSSYPSAHGHTPSYRSAASTVYPSALGSDTGSFSSGLSSRSALSDLDRDINRHVNSSLSTSMRSPLNTTTHSGSSSSSYKTKKYSSSSVSSTNGGLPHRESHHDSTYRSTRVGDSGIPHTSYAHTTSSFDSDRPYKNAVSNFSYNI